LLTFFVLVLLFLIALNSFIQMICQTIYKDKKNAFFLKGGPFAIRSDLISAHSYDF